MFYIFFNEVYSKFYHVAIIFDIVDCDLVQTYIYRLTRFNENIMEILAAKYNPRFYIDINKIVKVEDRPYYLN